MTTTPPRRVDVGRLRSDLMDRGLFPDSRTILALLDELEAARAVVEAARYVNAWDGDHHKDIGLDRLLDSTRAYDRAIAAAADDGRDGG